jgi:hypothetical protein
MKLFTGTGTTVCGISHFTMTPCWSMPSATSFPCWRDYRRPGINVRFHTPNALHIREITRPLARLMRRAGFHTIRLGLETTAFERRQSMDRKVNEDEFLRTIGHLKAAGFSAGQVGAYLLAGLPGQDVTVSRTPSPW